MKVEMWPKSEHYARLFQIIQPGNPCVVTCMVRYAI